MDLQEQKLFVSPNCPSFRVHWQIENRRYGTQSVKVIVNFSGGIQKECWRVTQSNGSYSVVYMPEAGYFSLCVDSALGPLDIGVHGPAIRCFSSV